MGGAAGREGWSSCSAGGRREEAGGRRGPVSDPVRGGGGAALTGVCTSLLPTDQVPGVWKVLRSCIPNRARR